MIRSFLVSLQIILLLSKMLKKLHEFIDITDTVYGKSSTGKISDEVCAFSCFLPNLPENIGKHSLIPSHNENFELHHRKFPRLIIQHYNLRFFMTYDSLAH